MVCKNFYIHATQLQAALEFAFGIKSFDTNFIMIIISILCKNLIILLTKSICSSLCLLKIRASKIQKIRIILYLYDSLSLFNILC